MKQSEIKFTECQYLGRDFNRISIRIVLAAFCFAAYYLTPGTSSEVFLVVASAILFGSVVMFFTVHYRTTIINNSVLLNALWRTRLVKIDLNNIIKVERRKYSSYIINSAVYNLHTNGRVRFYTSGKEAIVLTDRDGLEYVIGTQQPAQFEKALLSEAGL